MAESYQLFIYDVSYFSGKMQAYLRYKEVPHTTHEVKWKRLAFEFAESLRREQWCGSIE